MSALHTLRVDGVSYEAVTDLDGTPLLVAPELVEPWWYKYVPSGHCDIPPLTVDGYWHQWRMQRRRARWRRKGIIQVAT